MDPLSPCLCTCISNHLSANEEVEILQLLKSGYVHFTWNFPKPGWSYSFLVTVVTKVVTNQITMILTMPKYQNQHIYSNWLWADVMASHSHIEPVVIIRKDDKGVQVLSTEKVSMFVVSPCNWTVCKSPHGHCHPGNISWFHKFPVQKQWNSAWLWSAATSLPKKLFPLILLHNETFLIKCCGLLKTHITEPNVKGFLRNEWKLTLAARRFSLLFTRRGCAMKAQCHVVATLACFCRVDAHSHLWKKRLAPRIMKTTRLAEISLSMKRKYFYT